MPYYTAIFDKDVTDFYSWIIPKEGKLLIGSALAIKDKPNERFKILKDKMRSKGIDLGKKIKSEGTLINRPSNPGETIFGRDGVLLIGEAAGAISPSSAEGISYALRTAEMAYESIAEGFTGCAERYSRRAWKIKLNILLKNIKSPGMYDPFIRKAVIKSGIISIK
jgi:flavin-dependent dehydrogenase